MDKLEALISEALQKFPSEDIRELVAKETGLTVEQVSEKMNEAAKTAGDSFPAVDFALLKGEEIAPKEVAVEAAPKPLPTITYKEVFLPEASSSTGDNWSSVTVNDMSIQTKEVPEGTDLLDVAASEFDSYHVFAVVEGNTIQPVVFKSFGDISAEELGPKDKLTLVDGSVIFFAPKN